MLQYTRRSQLALALTLIGSTMVLTACGSDEAVVINTPPDFVAGTTFRTSYDGASDLKTSLVRRCSAGLVLLAALAFASADGAQATEETAPIAIPPPQGARSCSGGVGTAGVCLSAAQNTPETARHRTPRNGASLS